MNSFKLNKQNIVYTTFKNLDKVFKKTNIIFNFIEKGLEILYNDEYFVVRIFLDKEDIIEYEFKEEQTLSVDISSLVKNIGYILKDDKKNIINTFIKILFENDNFILTNNDNDTIKFPVLEVDEFVNFPDNVEDNYNHYITINSKIFNKKLSIMSKMDTDFFMVLKENNLELICTKPNLQSSLVIEGTMRKVSSEIIKSHFDTKTLFNVSLFCGFSENVNVFLGNNFPVFLSYNFSCSSINVIIAPKVFDE